MEKRQYTLDERIAYYENRIESLKVVVKVINKIIDKDTKWLINLKTGRAEMADDTVKGLAGALVDEMERK